MKIIFKRLATLAAVTALAVPSIAQAANPAAKLSVAGQVRSASGVSNANHLSEGTATLVNIGILAALVGIVLVATGGDDDDSSDSN